jgi:hypothetical protein
MIIKSTHGHCLFLGIANSFLYNNQNFTCESHPFWLNSNLGVSHYKKEAIILMGSSLFCYNVSGYPLQVLKKIHFIAFSAGFSLLSLTRAIVLGTLSFVWRINFYLIIAFHFTLSFGQRRNITHWYSFAMLYIGL